MKKYDITILIVEDDTAGLHLVKTNLARRISNVITAVDGREGLKKFLKHKPSIVLTDIEMPFLNGLEMSTEILKDCPDTKIVVMSAYEDTEYFVQAIDLGAESFLIKPLESVKLNHVIKKLISEIHKDEELIKKQKELEASEMRFRNVFKSMKDMVFVLDKNDVFREFYGSKNSSTFYEPKYFLKKDQKKIMPKNLSDEYLKYKKKLFLKKTTQSFEYELVNKTASGWFSANLDIHEDGESVVATVREITEQKQFQEKLIQSEMKFFDLFDNAPDMYFAVNSEGNVINVNNFGAESLGYSKDELIGDSVWKIVYKEDLERVQKEVSDILKQKVQGTELNFRKIRKDGSVLFVHEKTSLTFDETGDVAELRIICRDVTIVKELEQQKEEDHQKIAKAKVEWEKTFDNIDDIIAIVDENFNIIRANKAFAEMCNLQTKEMVDKKCYEVFHKMHKNPDYCKLHNTFNTGESQTFIYKEDRLNKYFLSTVTPLKDDDGKVFAAVFASKEITELKKQEEEIEHHRQHIKLINKILRHDIANNLAVINSAIKLYGCENKQEYLDESRNRVMRSTDLIRKMKELEDVIISGTTLRAINLHNSIDEVKRNYQTIQFKISGNERVFVEADLTINSVLDNLFRNAIEHGNASEIEISLEITESICNLKIADNGVGIPDEVKQNVFEEGFKFGKKGHTGIGLFIVKSAMNNYNGSISVHDNKPHGTIFDLKLNLADISS
jgi:PAS domain S-box-containing protein